MMLANYITLETGVPKRLHFTGHALVVKEIIDPLTNTPKRINTLTFAVDREDGIEVSKTFSVTAEKLAEALSPYLPGERYRSYQFTITRIGAGFQTRYSLAVTAM